MDLKTILELETILAPVLVPLVVMGIKVAINHLPEASRAEAKDIVGMVVAAVEQMGAAMPGPDKKAEAIRLAQAMGLKVDPAVLEVLIESAVAALPPTHSAPPASA